VLRQKSDSHYIDPLDPRGGFRFWEQQITGNFRPLNSIDSLNGVIFAMKEAPGASNSAVAYATRTTTAAQGKLAGRLTGVGNLILEASRFRN